MMKDELLIGRVFEKYKFTDPIPEAARASLLKSRRRSLKACLKRAGNYPIGFGLVLFIMLKSREIGLNFGIGISKITAAALSAAVIGSVSAGGYTVVKNIIIDSAPAEKKQETVIIKKDNLPDETAAEKEKIKPEPELPVNEIILYSGKVYRGRIISRGASFIIETRQGRIALPANQIKTIKLSQ